MNNRRSFLSLSPTELDRLADGFDHLFAKGRIATYADLHEEGWRRIHRGPAFLPWHRWFLVHVERELREFDSRISLPFWDWTKPAARDLEREPWKSFFGGRANSGGRFDHWGYSRGRVAGTPELGIRATVVMELQALSYADFRRMEFGSHVGGHTWTGGTMASPRSPEDPLFYLHHCMVDRMWALWQCLQSGVPQYSLDDNGTARYDESFVPKDSYMFSGPLGDPATPASMLNYRALGYGYEATWSTRTICEGALGLSPPLQLAKSLVKPAGVASSLRESLYAVARPQESLG